MTEEIHLHIISKFQLVIPSLFPFTSSLQSPIPSCRIRCISSNRSSSSSRSRSRRGSRSVGSNSSSRSNSSSNVSKAGVAGSELSTVTTTPSHTAQVGQLRPGQAIKVNAANAAATSHTIAAPTVAAAANTPAIPVGVGQSGQITSCLSQAGQVSWSYRSRQVKRGQVFSGKLKRHASMHSL